MKKAKKQSFIHGAMVLALAGIVVKVIGACFKIPLGAILKPEGMADFSIAYNIYALLFVLSTAGVPVAVSKMVAEAQALGRGYEVRRIYHTSYITFVIIGAVGSFVMFFGADAFAIFMGSPGSALAIRAIAPAVLFVSISSINRGYFQGQSNMYPTAASEVIEALGKLFIGLGAAWWLARVGFGTEVAAGGAVVGVSAGALLSVLYFFCIHRRGVIEEKKPPLVLPRRRGDIVRQLLHLAVPITLGAAVISLTNVIDSALVMNLLQKIGYTVRESMWLYGAYTYASNLFNLPSSLITTLGISLIPAVSAAFVRHDREKLGRTVSSSMRIAMLVALPSAAGMFVLAWPIMHLLYGGSLEPEAIGAAANMLAILALAIPFLGIVTLTNAIHQAMGHVRLPVISMLCGAGVKLVSNLILVSMPEVNIYGASVSTILCYGVIASINLAALKRYGVAELRLWSVFAKPGLAALITGFAAWTAYSPLVQVLGARIAALGAVFVGILACFAAVLFLGVLNSDDLSMLPGDKKITKILKKR